MIVSSLWRFPKIGAPLNHPKSDHCSIDSHPKIGVAPWYLEPPYFYDISMISSWFLDPRRWLFPVSSFRAPGDVLPTQGASGGATGIPHGTGPPIWSGHSSGAVGGHEFHRGYYPNLRTFPGFYGSYCPIFFWGISVDFRTFFCMASSSFIRVLKARISK